MIRVVVKCRGVDGGAMGCQVSREQLWSWVDRDAPELAQHLAVCFECRKRAHEIRSQIRLVAADNVTLSIPLPDRIGDFAIKRLIGEGGQALVYEAEQTSPRRAVAIKVLKGGPFVGRRDVRRFQREIQALAALNHPGIATIHQAGQTVEGQHFLVMELVPGTWLHVYLRDRSLGPRERLELFLRICEAVEYAHRHGIIHLDLKPTNILIDDDGNPKVLDFGLARIRRTDRGASLTESHLVEGTPRYMSPEQICARREEVGVRTDVFALGTILYEMLTGQPPHDFATLTPETIRLVCEQAPTPPSALDRTLRGDLDTIILHALEKAPADRYPSVAELAADVKSHLRGEPLRAPIGRQPPRWQRVHRALGRWAKPPVRWAGLIAVLLVAALAFWREPVRVEDPMTARREVAVFRCYLFAEPPDPVRAAAAIDAAAHYPDLMDAVLLAAHGNVRAREFRYATDLLERGLDQNPDAWPYRAMLSELSAELGREPTSSWSDADEARTIVTAEDWYMRALACLDRGRAIACARAAVEKDPGHVLALIMLTRLYRLEGDFASALDGAAALEVADRNGGYWTGQRGEILMHLGRYEAALGAFDSAQAAQPGDYIACYRRGMAQRRLKRYERAIEDFTRASELAEAGRSAWVIYHRGALHWMTGQREASVADYERASEVLGYATYGTARQILILRELGRAVEADSVLARARRGILQDERLQMVLSCLAGDLTPDELAAAADMRDRRQCCEAYYYAGEVDLAAGRIDEARVSFRRCLETGVQSDPDNPIEPMTEYELAEWRLARLAGSRDFP